MCGCTTSRVCACMRGFVCMCVCGGGGALPYFRPSGHHQCNKSAPRLPDTSAVSRSEPHVFKAYLKFEFEYRMHNLNLQHAPRRLPDTTGLELRECDRMQRFVVEGRFHE